MLFINGSIVNKLPNYPSIKLSPSKGWSASGGNWRRMRPAFSLIEITISMFLIAAFGVILTSASGSLLSRRRTDLTAIASKAATKEIEHTRNLAFTSVTSANNLACDAEFNQGDSKLPSCRIDKCVENYGGIPCTVDLNGNVNLKRVLITLSYNYQGKSRFVTMETLVTQGGL